MCFTHRQSCSLEGRCLLEMGRGEVKIHAERKEAWVSFSLLTTECYDNIMGHFPFCLLGSLLVRLSFNSKAQAFLFCGLTPAWPKGVWKDWVVVSLLFGTFAV